MEQKTMIATEQAPAAIGPYAQAVAVGGMLYTSGQIPLHPETGTLVGEEITAQAHQIFKNLQAVLAAAGSDFSKVIKTTCFLTDMADFAAFNTVYASYFGENKPARSCVAVKELPKGALAEVELIAQI